MRAEEVNAVPEEARPFQGKRAGIVSRVIANTIDFIVLLIALAATYASWLAVKFLFNPTAFSATSPTFLQVLVVGGCYLFVYFTIAWATTGRTYGDHVMGLRVVNMRGNRMHWIGAMLRSAFCVMVPIGLFWAVISPTERSIQDAVLRTSVIYDWSVGTADHHRGVSSETPARPAQ